MVKDIMVRMKLVGRFLLRESIPSSLIVAYLIMPILAWIGAQLLGFNQNMVLISVLIGLMIGLGTGLLLGWQWRGYRAMLGIENVAIGKYNQDLESLQQSKLIDMIGITFYAFGKFKMPVEEAFKKGAVIRVLLLDTTCPSFKEYIKKPEERSEIGLVGESKETVEALEEIRKKYRGQPGVGRITFQYFTSIPYRGCIITDTKVRYWPYLYSDHPENTPTYFINPESEIGRALKKEFETIWNEEYARKKRISVP